jgi:hypothetical protein
MCGTILKHFERLRQNTRKPVPEESDHCFGANRTDACNLAAFSEILLCEMFISIQDEDLNPT